MNNSTNIQINPNPGMADVHTDSTKNKTADSEALIKLNDYLYEGNTILRILKQYSADLKQHAITAANPIDLAHSNFLLRLTTMLEHNDFLTIQSQRISEFYRYMSDRYPYLAFTFRGRIKSLIRAEEKFNGYVTSCIYDYYQKYNEIPTAAYIREQVNHFKDMIAYRIVLCLPKCKISDPYERDKEELRLIYEIANELPDFLERQGFSPEISTIKNAAVSPMLKPAVRPFYKDYIANRTSTGYQSLHITFFDNMAHCYVEVQLRTKAMDDYAEIGPANHFGYEQLQKNERRRHAALPKGVCSWFDEAYERSIALQELDLRKVDVNMFTCTEQRMINDCCGLLRGRLILPSEHLSRFQTD